MTAYGRHYPGAWDDQPQHMHVTTVLGQLIDKEKDMTANGTKLDTTTLAGTTIPATEHDRSVDAVLHQSPTTTPSLPNEMPSGAVPTYRPNPGILRALLQPVLFLRLIEPVGAFEVGDRVAAQFWGEGRVMLTPLPMAAAKGRIPTTFPANKIFSEIAGPWHED